MTSNSIGDIPGAAARTAPALPSGGLRFGANGEYPHFPLVPRVPVNPRAPRLDRCGVLRAPRSSPWPLGNLPCRAAGGTATRPPCDPITNFSSLTNHVGPRRTTHRTRNRARRENVLPIFFFWKHKAEAPRRGCTRAAAEHPDPGSAPDASRPACPPMLSAHLTWYMFRGVSRV